MATDLNRSIKIYIDGSSAQKSVADLENEIADLTAKLAGLSTTEKGYEEKSKAMKAEIDKKRQSIENYKKSIAETERVLSHLSGATYKELLAVQKKIKNDLKELVPGTEKYTETLNNLRRVNDELASSQRSMRSEVGAQGNVFSRAANWVNRFGGIIASAAAAVTGLTLTIRKSVQDYAKMEEAMANVRKYTGMTTDEVKELNEALKKMDTRTSREKLNALAGDAGRLGITSKEAILEFVDAADKINVALGEDLGEDAVKNIGKLAQMFGEDKELGLRGAMLATGSAINEVAQSCSASEPYLVDFTARVAGVANQAGITQADIIGFAASMDENMLQSEKSSTAFQKVLMKMFTDADKFATAAGLDVKEFSDLVRKDAMEAMLTFAEALSKKGGLYDLAPIFGDLKTEGAGVASMLSVMAGKAQEIRSRQGLANQAYKEGTSILKEYEVQNTTIQASLDKAKKGFLEVSIELGQKLQPAMSHVISGTSALVRILNNVIGFVTQHIGLIMTLTTAIVSYTVALKAQAAWQTTTTFLLKSSNAAAVAYRTTILLLSAAKGLLTGNTIKMNAALLLAKKNFTALFAVLRANPFGIIASAVAAITYGMYRLSEQTKRNSDVNNLLADAAQRAADKTHEERTAIERLQEKLNDNTKGYTERKKALEALKKLVPGYHADLTTEGELINNNAEALDRYNKLIGVQNEIKEVTKELNKHKEALETAENAKRRLMRVEHIKRPYGASNPMLNYQAGQYDQEAKIVEGLTERLKELQEQEQRIMDLAKKKPAPKPDENPEITITEPSEPELTDKEKAKRAKEAARQLLEEERQRIAEMKALRDQELTEIEAAYNAQIELQQMALEQGTITQEEYQVWEVGFAHASAEKKLAVEQDYQAKFKALVLTHQELVEKAQQESDKRVVAQQARTNNAKLKAQHLYEKNMEAIKKMANSVETTPEAKLEAEYQTKLALLESYYKASLQYAKEHGKSEAEITKTYEEVKLALKNEYADKLKKLLENLKRDEAKLEGNDIYDQVTKITDGFNKLKDAIKSNDFEGIAAGIQSVCNAMLSGLSNAFNTFKQIEIDNVEAKYDAEIAAAEGNTEKIEQLEQEKAQAKLDIEKKYADVDFAVKCSQIIANTALAIMMAYSQLGPIAGNVAAALMGATGAIQLAAAVAEREKVKNMTLSGSGSGSNGTGSRQATGRTTQYAAGRYDVIGADDGKTYKGVPYIGAAPTGIVRRPALISESGAELIVNADDLRRLQHHVNYPLVVEAINESRKPATPTPQHASGNYAPLAKSKGNTPAQGDETAATLRQLTEVLAQIKTEGIPAYTLLSEFEKQQRIRAKARKIGSK